MAVFPLSNKIGSLRRLLRRHTFLSRLLCSRNAAKQPHSIRSFKHYKMGKLASHNNTNTTMQKNIISEKDSRASGVTMASRPRHNNVAAAPWAPLLAVALFSLVEMAAAQKLPPPFYLPNPNDIYTQITAAGILAGEFGGGCNTLVLAVRFSLVGCR